MLSPVCIKMMLNLGRASHETMNDIAALSDETGPNPERQARLFVLLYSANDVEARARRIYDAMLAESPQIRQSNFRLIGADDLERLFGWYDREFFRGRLGEMLLEDGAYPVTFRLSRRLTIAAGQTIRRLHRSRQNGKPAVRIHYEITVSATLLYSTFQNVERTVTVGGRVCRDRLEALQRIFEHELLHLAEFLGWGRSNCRADNFHALSRRIFAHEGAFHDLITPREEANAAFDIHIGDRVCFRLDGISQIGHVNRITRRATVLVESPRGVLYSDGKYYLTFYVPLPLLMKHGDA
jgi:hypothetical protein